VYRSCSALKTKSDRDDVASVRPDLSNTGCAGRSRVDQEGKVLGLAIGAVGGEALRLQPEALGRAVEHGAGGPDLRLPGCPAALDVEDDRVVGVGRVVGGIGEEGMALMGAGPLRRRIRRRDEPQATYSIRSPTLLEAGRGSA